MAICAVVARMLSVGKALLCAFVSSWEFSTLFGSHKGTNTRWFVHFRHPELVSGSISPHRASVPVAGWMLNRVQHDVKESLAHL